MIWKCAGVIAGLCCLVLPTRAQTSQWRDVEMLVPGVPISVVIERRRQGCELIKVTDLELTCDQDIGQVTRTYVFARDQVREVRREIPEQNKLIVGAIAGAVVGGLLGFLGGQQSSDPEVRGYARVFGIPMGAFIGGAVGSHIHRHGEVVYSR